jgi:hypothetical protein
MPPRRRRTSTEVGGTRAATAAAPQEDQLFFPDGETTPRGKNDRLADVLTATSANELAIVSIKRLEIGATGWLITYRK